MTRIEQPLLMLVDDNPQNLSVLASILDASGYEIIICMSGEEALLAIETDIPDLILLDIMMPGMDGYELCQRIKADERFEAIPILFLTAKSDGEDVVKGFEVGGSDYVMKPFHEGELRMRIKNQLELSQVRSRLQAMNDQLVETNASLTRAYEDITQKNQQMAELLVRLEQASSTDPLTGLYNRRYMRDRIDSEIAHYKRTQNSFSIIIADVDFFKNVNDQYGHDCGDYALKRVTECLHQCLRGEDVLSRWGGEEFLVLLPETTVEGARHVAERMRQQVEETPFVYEDKTFRLTMTFGISEYVPEEPVDRTIIQADRALFQGKAGGRNQVCG